MKKSLSILASLVVPILISFTSVVNATSLKILPSPDITVNAGQIISLAFDASGWPSNQTAEIWLKKANDQSSIGQLTWIGVPVKNARNTVKLTIPWSWSEGGKYVVRVVASGLVRIGSTIIRIRSAVIWPYGGSTFQGDAVMGVRWVPLPLGAAHYMTISLWNEETGEVVNLEKYNEVTQKIDGLTDRLDPTSGHVFFVLPDVSGTKFRLILAGYLEIPDYGPDISALSNSERFIIQ